MSSYNNFVREMMPQVMHLSPPQRMQAIGKMWRQRGGGSQPILSGGGARQRRRQPTKKKPKKSDLEKLILQELNSQAGGKKPTKKKKSDIERLVLQELNSKSGTKQRGKGKNNNDMFIVLDTGHIVNMDKDLDKVYGFIKGGGLEMDQIGEGFFKSLGNFFKDDIPNFFKKKSNQKAMLQTGVSLLPALL